MEAFNSYARTICWTSSLESSDSTAALSGETHLNNCIMRDMLQKAKLDKRVCTTKTP